MPVSLDDLITPFYEEVGPKYKSTYQRGQIFWTHIGYTREDLHLWRPTAYDASQTAATAFQVVRAGGDAFHRAVPLQTPPLKTNEEFVAVTAKRRPVILVGPVPPDPGVRSLRHGGKIYRRLAVVVPIYSMFNRLTGELKYPLEFVEQIRVLRFPEFLFLPPCGILEVPSFARVAEMQAVYEPHLEPENVQLAPTAMEILGDQIGFLTTGRYSGTLADYREELLHQEPGTKSSS